MRGRSYSSRVAESLLEDRSERAAAGKRGVLPEAAVRNEILAAGLRPVTLTDFWAERTLWIGARSRETLSPEAVRLFDFMSGLTGS